MRVFRETCGGYAMADVFISYSTTDEEFARTAHKALEQQGLSAFLAGMSLKPGDVWGDKIHSALRASPTVLCLMSKAACASPYVNQEFGMALSDAKTIIPVVWDMDPAELPGWLRKFQALDLRHFSVAEYAGKLNELADNLKSKKDTGQLVLIGAALAFAFVLLWGEK